MKRSAKEKLKAALLAAAREELARFEALPADGLTFSPDFEERFRALSEGAKKPDRPVRAFPARRLAAALAAAFFLLFLFIVPVSADGRSLAVVVKDLFVPNAPKEIGQIYTLDLPDDYIRMNRAETLTHVATEWLCLSNEKKKIRLAQFLRGESSMDRVKDTYETAIIGDQLYYHSPLENNLLGYRILWRTEEYDFNLQVRGETDLNVCYEILKTLRVEQDYTAPSETAVTDAVSEGSLFLFALSNTPGEYVITKYLGTEDDPVFPAEYNDMPVTEIGARAFRGCTFLTTIHIPASIRRISSAAFADCVNLKTVVMTKNTHAIHKEAFSGCSAIENFVCDPNCLPDIEKENLKTLKLVTIFKNAGASCRDCPNLRSLEIEEGFTSISGIHGCPNLEEIKLPQSIKKIGGSAFKSCKKLKEIIFPDEMEEIGAHAFEGCETLETVTIPKNVTSIGEGPFMGCLSLREINVDPENPVYSSVDGVLFTKDGKELLQYPGGKTGAYRIPDEVEKIHAAAFWSCAGVTEITLPAGKGWLESAGSKVTAGSMEYAFTLFHDCSAMQAVWIDGEDPQICSVDGVLFTKDGSTLLLYPAGREGAYEIPDGVSILAFGAFRGSRGLTAVTLPETLTVIHAVAFQKCSSLTSMHIPYSVTLIRGSAFYDCDNLTAYTYDGTLAEWDAIQAKMDGIPAPYTVTAADGSKGYRLPWMS